MSLHAWSIIIGIATAVLLAFAPWMMMVHAKLAVVATEIAELDEKIKRARLANQELWDRHAHHDVRLQTHDVQFAHIAERLQEM